MPNPYREILTIPGAAAFSAAGLAARFPAAMVGIGIVLMVSGLTGSYGTAGSVAATFVIAQAVCGPQLARLVDRFGQFRVMAPSTTFSATALAALVVAAATDAPSWTMYVSAAAAGATIGSFGALARARWAHQVRTPRQLHRAYSLESAADESTFVLGPVVVTALATAVAPWAGVATALVLIVVGGFSFLLQRGTEPPLAPVVKGGPRRRSVVRSPAMLGLLGTFVGIGGIFGATDVAVVAFTAERDRPGSAGLVLGIFALGSMIAGLLYGAISWTGPVWRRFVVGLALLAAGTALFGLITSVGILAAVMFLTGFAISPSLINGTTLVQHIVPRERLTEGLAWMGTAINAGLSLGSSVAGASIDAGGSRAGFTVVMAAGALAVVMSVVSLPAVRRQDRVDHAHVPAAAPDDGGARPA